MPILPQKLKIHELFLEWSLDYLDSQKTTEKAEDKIINDNTKDRTEELKTQISSLTMMRAKNLIDDDEYLKKKNTLNVEIEKLKKKEPDENKKDEIELTRETFEFAIHAIKKFTEGSKNEKREVLVDLGSNRIIKDKKVLIKLNKWYLPIYENAETYNRKLARLEPTIPCLDYNKSDALASLRLAWLGDRDSNPDSQDQNLKSYH